MRILGLDPGLNLGFAAAGGHRPVISGSRRLRGGPRKMGETAKHCQDVLLKLIDDEHPDLVGFASPFVGQTYNPMTKKFSPIPPDNIRPLFGCLAVIEMTCLEMGIPCVEVEEGEARRMLLGSGQIPRKSKDIKAAIQRALRQRNMGCSDEHGADALCVALFIWECKNRNQSHRTTPLFS